jgi:hypothetical protein
VRVTGREEEGLACAVAKAAGSRRRSTRTDGCRGGFGQVGEVVHRAGRRA